MDTSVERNRTTLTEQMCKLEEQLLVSYILPQSMAEARGDE